MKKECGVQESCTYYERYANTPSVTAQRLFYYLQWAGFFSCRKDFYISRQDFNSILLIQTLEGSGKLYYRDREYILDKHKIALIDCREHHVYYPVSEDEWSFYFLHFQGGQSMEWYQYVYEQNEGCVMPANKKLKNDVADCIMCCKERGASYEVKTSRLLSDLWHEMLLTGQREEYDKIAMLCDYIGENYSRSLSTREMAELAGFSRCYFATIFKKHTGTTPHEYLLRYRLDKAKAMLLDNRYSIGEISEKIGFNDTGTFIRMFKRKEGVSPMEYRKSHF